MVKTYSKITCAIGMFPLIAACSPSNDINNKNVLFIIADDMKPTIGCFGDTTAITPFMDQLGKSCTIFNRAYCQQALSGPTRASLLTGLRPNDTGVTELNTWMRAKNPDIITLPQIFKNAGYETRGVGKIFHGDKNSADSLSWSKYPCLFSYTKKDDYILDRNKTGKKASASEFTSDMDNKYFDVKIRDEAIRELRELAAAKKPFFLAVGFLKPHLPFCAPERFLDLYEESNFDIDTTAIKNAPSLAYHNNEELRGYTDIPDVGDIDSSHNMLLKKAYYACVSFTDENIGILIKELKDLGLFDNTVIVIVGDHGYHTGEQGLWCKSTNYEAACKAPLMIKDANQKEGRYVNSPVEFVDIFPTICRLCKIEPPKNLAGKYILATDYDKHDHFAISQFPRPYNALHHANLRTHMGYAIRNSSWTYVEWHDTTGKITDRELYLMRNTTLEKENLAGIDEYKDTCDRLSTTLSEYL